MNTSRKERIEWLLMPPCGYENAFCLTLCLPQGGFANRGKL
eukprot:CAMPEP_0185811106 /NCGR_PEP_ID=MMETSP1322-20130828/7550_1 /TAXON_ID=265543 /ORGANISM="Minutocellus polymorphus, Strain RCC2270" /LENGTH=40 /DNA_ID= /DNA_START= /DNA_END= /DNA_ORIENTATION=